MSHTTPQRPSNGGRAAESDRDPAQDHRDALTMAQLVQDHATRAIERHLAMVAESPADADHQDAEQLREHDHSA